MTRSVLSVIAGYAVWTLVFLGGGAAIQAMRPGVHDAEGLTTDAGTLAVYLMLSVIASLIAGLTSARLSARAQTVHGLWLAVCLLATGIPVQLSVWNQMPAWYHVSFLVLLAPMTLLGTRVYQHKGSVPAVSA